MQWYEVTPRLSPPQPRRLDPGWCVHPMVLQPSRLSPLTQSPLSSMQGSPVRPRPRPRPGHTPPSLQSEASEITLLPPSTASFSRKSSPSPSAASASPGRRSQRGFSPRHHCALTTGPEASPPQPPAATPQDSGGWGTSGETCRTPPPLSSRLQGGCSRCCLQRDGGQDMS